MLSDEFFKARQDFNERYPKSIRRASYLTPVFGGLQVAVFISQFSAINTLTHAKVGCRGAMFDAVAVQPLPTSLHSPCVTV